MPRQTFLGEIEQLVLLAVHRLGKKAYAVAIRDEICNTTGMELSRGTVYVTLHRLESKGYLRSRMGTPTPARGGRRKRFYRVTASGVSVLKSSKQTMVRLWDGLDSILGKNP